jgi:hypothetical protein
LAKLSDITSHNRGLRIIGDAGANTVSTIRPAGEVVSAQGSESERKPASASLILASEGGVRVK